MGRRGAGVVRYVACVRAQHRPRALRSVGPGLLAYVMLAGCKAAAVGGEMPRDPAPAPSPVDSKPQSRSQQLHAAVEAWHDAGLFDGAILVADKGEVVFEGAFGPADREDGRANSPQTPFAIASLTKQFTAVLVMMQVEQHRLELDDVITDVLPWYRAETGQKISVRDLLSHTSGLPDVDTSLYMLDDRRAAQSRWAVESFGSGDLQFEPGTQFAYTNTDYHVLGAMLEEITGQTFAEVLDKQILNPLGMRDSGIAQRETDDGTMARDYVRDAERWVEAPRFRLQNWQGAGGMVSTLADLHRWNRALANNELVSAQTWETMLTPRTDLPGGGNYVGLGSWVYPRPLPGTDQTPKLIERRGAIGGFAVLNVLVADSDRWVVVLSNHYNEDIHTLPFANCLPLDLLLVLYGQPPQGPGQAP